MLVAVDKDIAEMNVVWTIKFDELTASLNSFKAQHTKRLEIVEASLGGRMSGGSPLSGGSDCGATPKHASRRFLSPFVKPDPKLAVGLLSLS